MRTLLARFVLRCMRWTTVVDRPIPDKCVVLGFPLPHVGVVGTGLHPDKALALTC